MNATELVTLWAGDTSLDEQVVILAQKVRDIPYGRMGSRDPWDVYNLNKGTCSGKHELLKLLYQEIQVPVRGVVAMHRFKNLPVQYSPELTDQLNAIDIIDFTNFLQIERNSNWVTVNITWDAPLQKLGFPVTDHWDGKSDMRILVEQMWNPEDPIAFKKAKIAALPEEVQHAREIFLESLTDWLEQVRDTAS